MATIWALEPRHVVAEDAGLSVQTGSWLVWTLEGPGEAGQGTRGHSGLGSWVGSWTLESDQWPNSSCPLATFCYPTFYRAPEGSPFLFTTAGVMLLFDPFYR